MSSHWNTGTPSTSGDDERTEEVSVSSVEWRAPEARPDMEADPWSERSGSKPPALQPEVEFATAATARLNMLFQPASVPVDTLGRMDQVCDYFVCCFALFSIRSVMIVFREVHIPFQFDQYGDCC